MLIILEGPDGAGKTMLARKLAAELLVRSETERVDELHRGPPEKHPLDEYEHPLWNYRPSTGHHVICDRWHVGEWVYPQVLDRPSEMDNAAWYHIELFLQSRGAVLVLVDGDPDVLTLRVAQRGGGHDEEKYRWQCEHAWKIHDLFEEACRRSILPSWKHITTARRDPPIEPILAAAQLAEELGTRSSRYGTYIGSPLPRVLLLGERRGDGPNAPPDVREGPAFGPYPGTSGRFLLNALGTLPDFVRTIGLANACEEPELFHMWKNLGSPPIVTLGREATKCVQTWLPIPWPGPVAEVPHPQYVRRFQHGKIEQYADLIANSVGKIGKQPWNLRSGWPKRWE